MCRSVYSLLGFDVVAQQAVCAGSEGTAVVLTFPRGNLLRIASMDRGKLAPG